MRKAGKLAADEVRKLPRGSIQTEVSTARGGGRGGGGGGVAGEGIWFVGCTVLPRVYKRGRVSN